MLTLRSIAWVLCAVLAVVLAPILNAARSVRRAVRSVNSYSATHPPSAGRMRVLFLGYRLKHRRQWKTSANRLAYI